MNKVFRKLPFPAKLIALGTIPLLFLIYFSIQIIREKQERNLVVKSVIENINTSIIVNELATNLHKERRYSFAYILDRATSPELVAQWSKTDEVLSRLEKNRRESFKSYVGLTLLDQLKSRRRLILSKQMSGQQALFYYSNVLTRIHSFYNTSVENVPYLEGIAKDLKSQRLIFEVVNQFGILRASIYSMAIKRTFTESELDFIEKENGLTNSFSAEYNLEANAEAIKQFSRLAADANVKSISETTNYITKNRKLPPNFDAEQWWTASGALVDEIIRIESGIIEATKKNAELLAEKEANEIYKSIFLLVFIIILVIFTISYTIKNINGALNELRLAAEQLAKGSGNIRLNIHSEDSIGSLAKSIEAIQKNNEKLAHAADEIGKGNFNIEVKPRDNNDIIGNAVLKMRNDLANFSVESKNKIWVQSGLTLVNDSIRGERSLLETASSSLNSLVNYLGAQVALFYHCNDSRLHLVATYAVSARHNIPETLSYGETLIGQAAVEQRIIHLSEIPDDYVKISSASGDAKARHLIIIPLLHNGALEGVIEVGSVIPFPEAALDLLKQASVSIAIGMHTAQNRSKLQELLEQTQAQTEELQAQHSELENLNTELEAQAQKLQASEEELKVQQEELLQANQELEERSKILEEKNQLIVERNLDIQKKAEELELSTKYKSEFLANMSHELRTPLNSILLLSRLMSENTENNLTDDQIESARVIQSSGNGLLALIDEILDLSKIEAGKMDLEFAEVSVKEVTGELRALFSPIAKEKNLELKIELSEGVPARIVTDKMRLEQILKNLLSNALKFTAKGSVSLSVNASADASFISYSVKDTGIGIPADKQKHIFEAFQQADGSTKRKFGGTGLGLSISRELARLLGGEILLSSEPGKGSEFILTIPVNPDFREKKEERVQLPVSTPASELVPEPPARQESRRKLIVSEIPPALEDDRDNISGSEKVILIIEDDTNFAKALLSFTRKNGYKGLVAVRGDLGVEMAQTYKPAAILLDIQLPVKDGWEVMEELKSNPTTRPIPVHIMSSLQAKKESLIKGAVDFINKPVAIEQMQQMFSKLEEALNRDPKKVLIIEENARHAKALSYFLETFNVRSEIKENVSDGVAALQQQEVNCVILDMGIPDPSSYDTLEEIKRNEGLDNIPIIVFTGKNLSKSEENKLKQYADTIVMKTAHSYQRILDEVALFLHLVEEKDSDRKSSERKNLMELNEVLKGKTVLIADDDVRNIFSLSKALEKVKMNVLSATDGKEALRVLEENPQVDVVLMDMMMPELDGYESTATIRKNPKYKDLPILAVTAKAMTGDREKCIRAGASDYISKPVDIDQLVSLLRVWLYDKHV